MQLQTIVHTIPPLYDSESRVCCSARFQARNPARSGSFTATRRTGSGACWRLCLARRCRSPSRTSARCACGIMWRCGTPSPNAILRARPTRLSATPSRTTSANCSARAKLRAFLPPAASRRSCTANSSSRKPACPSRSCPPPSRSGLSPVPRFFNFYITGADY